MSGPFKLAFSQMRGEELGNSRMLCGMFTGSWVLGSVRSCPNFLSGKRIRSRMLRGFEMMICSRILLSSRMLCGVLSPSRVIGESILLSIVSQVAVFCLWIFAGATGRVEVEIIALVLYRGTHHLPE